jgi:regulator of PEP synthase PpsR (kinase-PPPase family)
MKKSILISEEIHKKLKVYCANNGIKIIDWIEELIQKELEKEVKNADN